MATQRRAIRECIEANAAAMALHPGDRMLAFTLATKNDRLWSYYARVTGAERDALSGWTGDGSPAALLGPNGAGPAIDDLIKSSAWHRARANSKQKESANA